MQLADRAMFEDQLGALCAGFNVPMTDLRTDAYWRGLQKMQLGQFARVVEFALGESGPERIPTVPQCWNILRQQRTNATKQPQESSGGSAPAFDAMHGFGQRCLMRWLFERGPVDELRLTRLIAEKNRLVADFREIARSEEVTAEEVRQAMFGAFARAAA